MRSRSGSSTDSGWPASGAGNGGSAGGYQMPDYGQASAGAVAPGGPGGEANGAVYAPVPQAPSQPSFTPVAAQIALTVSVHI